MIEFISSWARQIIIAVLISIILEMLLISKSKNSKYIRTVIGIYIVYTIIAPILSLLGKNNFDFANIDYESYFINSSAYEEAENNLELNTSKLLEEDYKENLKNDFEEKLAKKGYEITEIDFKVNLDEDNEKYGTIEKVEMSLNRLETIENNNISVDKIEIGNKKSKESDVTSEEKNNLKSFINQEYGIEINDIIIE